jgi:hypothetical protein
MVDPGANGYPLLIGTTTANSNMTIGLTINQAGADIEILTLKSSDVNHGITDNTGTDTWATFKKAAPAEGGMKLAAYLATGSTSGCYLFDGCMVDDADATRSTSGRGFFRFMGNKKSGSGAGAMAADKNLLTIENAGTTRFIFDTDGSGHADVEWTTYSDSRLKKNVETIPYGLDTVRGLDARIFDKYSGYIDDDGEVVLENDFRRMIGFIAQEVQPLVPELVKDVDDKSFYSLDVGRFTPILWSAVKELDTTVQDYQTRIEALEAALTELQGA